MEVCWEVQGPGPQWGRKAGDVPDGDEIGIVVGFRIELSVYVTKQNGFLDRERCCGRQNCQ
eukprot:7347357-Prorocentrum_lima.AAC.1